MYGSTHLCTFVLPNGKQCKKQHLRQFCFYEDPTRCQDARVREIVVKKLEAMKTSSMAGNDTRVDTYETFCMDICDAPPPQLPAIKICYTRISG
jgi:hypothetical protein